MAFTKVVGAGIHTLSNITSHNINSSGIITATKFVGPLDGTTGDFSGNVTIDGNLTVNGTTTTLDTNLIDVDKIEVTTAGNNVAVAITHNGSGDLVRLYDGSTQVVTVDDEGNVTSTGDLIISSSLPRITLNDTNHESDFDIKNENGSFRIRDLDNPTDRYRINSSGTIHEFFGAADFNSHLTVDGNLYIADSIINSSDTNTKIRFPAADTFTVETGGSERFRIDDNGKVTIGIGASANNNSFLTIPRLSATGSPLRLISLRNDTAPPDLDFVKSRSTTYGSYAATQDDDFVMAINSYIDNGSALAYRGTFRSIYDTATAGVHFIWGSGTSPSTTGEKMRLTADGKVGIGTVSPDHGLHVYKESGDSVISIESVGNDNHSAIEFIRTSSGGNSKGAGSIYVTGNTSASEAIMKFAVGHNVDHEHTPSMVIMGNGEVGIGEQAPDTKLEILHSSSTNPNTENLIHLRTDPGGGYVSRGLYIKIGRDLNYDNSGAFYDIVGSGSNSGFHAFQVSGNDILRITKDGNIGIGLTTTASVNVLNEPTKFRELTLGGRTEGAAIHLKDDNDNVQAGLFTSDSTNAMIIRTITNHPMMFRTNNSERLRIANDGKVGISTGTIDPNGNQLLIRAASTVGTKNAHIMLTGDSATIDQGPQIVFSESGGGSNYAGGSIGFQRKGSNSMGDLIFGTRQSTGDVNTTTTEVLRITSGGNVGIGTDDPSAPLNVHKINGTIAVFGDDRSGDNSTFECIKIKNNVTAYPAITCDSSNDTLDLRSMGNVQVTIDSNNNSTGKYFRVVTNGEGNSGTELFRIEDDGMVGIGTIDPACRMHLLAGNDRACVRLHNTYPTPDNVWELQPGISGVTNTGFCIRDITDSANRFVIDGSGNVGINVNNPQSKFEVLESTTAQSETQKRIAIFRKNGTALGDEGYIHLTTMTGHYGVKLGYRNEGASPGYLNQGFFISTVNSGETIDNHTKKFVIRSDGNVGIAETNPSYKLHIETAATNSTQVTGLAIANDASSSGVGAKINLGAGSAFDSTSAAISGWYDGTGTSLSLFTTSSYASTNHTERLRITNDGRVKFGNSLPHQLHTQTFVMYPDNGSNNTTRLTFTGLQFGTYIAQIGYYNAAGQGYGGGIFHVSGYQTATYTYKVHEIDRWDTAGNSSISAVTKSGSSWYVDITNTHGSYTGGGEVSVIGDAQVTCTITYV